MSNHTTNILDAQSDYASIRIYRNTIEFLNAKVAKRKKHIHPEHSARFNHDMQSQ